MAAPVSEVLPDAGVCRWCPHGQWSHKRGRGGCRELDCTCHKYEVDPAAQRAEKERVLTAVAEVCDSQAAKARAELAAMAEANPSLGVQVDPERAADIAAEASPVDPVEVVDVVKRRRRTPVPLPGGDPVPDPAVQAEPAEQVAAIDELLVEEDGPLPLPPREGRRVLIVDQDRIEQLTTQLGARLRDLDQAQEQVAQLQRGARVLSAERNEARTELANLRREVVEREEQIARERGARSAEIAQLREELARATTARQRTQEQLDTAVHTGLSAVSQVIGRYTAHACLTCGARYGLPFTDHGCGPLVPVVVTIARADRPGPNTSKEQQPS
ncbi:hypothetical protein [Micromonospora sediminicola]|uniref:hypothetical protein n=1 Tax=Micromonospora sediminicola TaxID=946078 RepID=UPI00379894A8